MYFHDQVIDLCSKALQTASRFY